MNFALIASIVFGKKGYVFASGLLSTLLLGWYAVQTGITGNLIHTAFDLNYLTMTVIANHAKMMGTENRWIVRGVNGGAVCSLLKCSSLMQPSASRR